MVDRRRFALHASIALILAQWAYSLASHLWREGPTHVPGSVAEIARFVLVNGAIRIALIVALLRGSGEGAAAMGLRREGAAGQLLRGAGFGVLILLVANAAFAPLVDAILPASPEGESPIAHLFEDTADLPLWIFCGVIGGGLIEELSRIFVLTRFERAWGRRGLLAALAVDTVVFGVGHLYQGVDGALVTGLAGLGYALVYLRRRSALEAIAAHAFYDVIGIGLSYVM